MGFRFRQRIKVLPGVYINLGKKGINSTSVKAGWLTANLNKDGVKHTIGAHGTGLSYETKRSKYSGKFLWIVFVIFAILYLFHGGNI